MPTYQFDLFEKIPLAIVSMKHADLVPQTVFLVVVSMVTLPMYAHADDASPTTFDQFIDSSPGSEVGHQGDFPNDAYRAKRVNKNLWTFIDRRGYYITFRTKLEAWCEENGGVYRGSGDDLKGVCLDKQAPEKVLGAYRVEITRTASYGDQMTAGYATFYYYNQDGYAQRKSEEVLTEQTKREIDQNNQQCYQDQLRAIQQNPQPGMNTNLGMVIDVKLPLALIQNTAYNPTTQWVRVAQLAPVPKKFYCSGSVLPGTN
jgi:hypothetical protein